MRAPARGDARDVLAEQRHRAAVGRNLAGDLVEERGLAGAVGADDQAALAGRDHKVDAVRDTQPSERLVEAGDGKRGHEIRSSVRCATAPGTRARVQPQAARARRTEPGTRPSGMKLMMRM